MGLKYLHTKCHIIHTDIKPENILLTINENYVRKLASETNQWLKLAARLPRSFICSDPNLKNYTVSSISTSISPVTISSSLISDSNNDYHINGKKVASKYHYLSAQLAELEQLEANDQHIPIRRSSYRDEFRTNSSTENEFGNDIYGNYNPTIERSSSYNNPEHSSGFSSSGGISLAGSKSPEVKRTNFTNRSLKRNDYSQYNNSRNDFLNTGYDANYDLAYRFERSGSDAVSSSSLKRKEAELRRVASSPGKYQ